MLFSVIFHVGFGDFLCALWVILLSFCGGVFLFVGWLLGGKKSTLGQMGESVLLSWVEHWIFDWSVERELWVFLSRLS